MTGKPKHPGPSGPDDGTPPRGPVWRLLRRLLPREDRGELAAAVEELFRLRVRREGRRSALRWYRREWTSALVRLWLERARTMTTTTGARIMATLNDARLALRRLARTPGFTAAALLTLALGIGAGTFVFSVVDRVVLRPLPYPEADELVALWPGFYFTRGNFGVVERDARTLDEVGLWIGTDGFNLESDGRAVRVTASRVTPSVLTLLRVTPATGRLFRPEESGVGRDRVVMLSHGFWIDRFAGDPDVVGTDLRLDGASHRIVGVLPRGFTFPRPDDQLLLPVQTEGVALGEIWGYGGYQAIGRLADGATLDGASAELERLAATMRTENPVWTPSADFYRGARVADLHASLVGDVRGTLLLLLGAVGVVLLVVCANVANLLLSRGIARSRESAVRVAMGAGRGSLVRDHLTESLLLSLGGCVLGAGAAWLGLDLLGSLLAEELPRGTEVAVDGRILAAAAGASLLTGVLAGVAPAVRSASVAPARALREGGRGGGASRGRRRLSRLLVTAQVAAAAVLVIGAGLLGRSLSEMAAVDPGFDPGGVLTARVTLAGGPYAEPASRLDFLERLQARIEALPGVRTVAFAGSIPFGRHNQGVALRIEGVTTNPNELPTFDHYNVGPGYGEALGLTLVEGRWIEPTDSWDTEQVALIDASAAREFFPDESPLGKRVGWPYGESPWFTVVGVVEPVKDDGVTEAADRSVYTAFAQQTPMAASLLVRHGGEAGALAEAVREAVAELDATVTVSRVAPYPALLADSYARARLVGVLLAVFAGVTLLLGCLGVYGVAAYAVRDRTREIGIRMALGAEGGRIRGSVVRDGLLLVVPGALAGVALAVPATAALEGLLFGVTARDPLTFVAVPLVLSAAALLAVYAPARRATRVDPARVLQSE